MIFSIILSNYIVEPLGIYLENRMAVLMMKVVPSVISNLQYNHGYKVQTVDFVLVNCGNQVDAFYAV